ncbi:DUF1289 domain-containing protein [Sphingomonas canadensis]|uniref:DUF1289 domain-containing protein n=1 Tax=Sphingomonas canadensis TaxID=1219257 RepID=A0ABW3H7U2_9SPHN|nr:DUF1289 domain-containing protein [Sphingomonas canadensis]MCW3836387.1 DUF1289 domain-containing protein [Sphingomonas canadensis]
MWEVVPVIESPCVNICRIDRKTRWCEGCGRTAAEITRWGETDDADRKAVMAELPARMRAMRRGY